jgi:hypothetical protein
MVVDDLLDDAAPGLLTPNRPPTSMMARSISLVPWRNADSGSSSPASSASSSPKSLHVMMPTLRQFCW